MKPEKRRLVYDLKDLEGELKIGRRTLREYAKQGRLKARKIGRAYYVSEKALMEFVEQR